MGGDGFVTINGKTTALEAGYVYLIPPDTTFSCWCETAIEKLYVDVFAEIVPGCDLFSERNAIARKSFDQEAILRLCNAEARGTLSDQLFLLGAVTQVLAEFAQEGPLPVSREILRFRPLLEEMDRQLSAQLRVSSIARQLGWEPLPCPEVLKNFWLYGKRVSGAFTDEPAPPGTDRNRSQHQRNRRAVSVL